MKKKLFIVVLLTGILVSATAFYTHQMSEGTVSVITRTLKSSVFHLVSSQAPTTEKIHASAEEQPATEEAETESDKDQEPKQAVSCGIIEPVIPQYNAEYLGSSLDVNFSKGDLFKITMSFKNTGNMTWFSANSGCADRPVVNLGTDRIRDRASIFATDSNDFESYWAGNNRIKMKSPRVDPGEIGYFEFWNTAPQADDIFIEYFTPVVEGKEWLEQGMAKLTIRVGLYDHQVENRSPYAVVSRGLTDLNVSEEKNIVVDVSEQIMHLRIGEDILHTFPVSTGAARTPTPYGTTRIKFKQHVRVGGKWPHYVMPRFMWFREGGYGIHALPSLSNDGGTFWREARSHIQRRVSHGCVRLLPEDAEVAYEFAEAGTRVTVQP